MGEADQRLLTMCHFFMDTFWEGGVEWGWIVVVFLSRFFQLVLGVVAPQWPVPFDGMSLGETLAHSCRRCLG